MQAIFSYIFNHGIHILIYMVIGGDDEDLKILWGSNFFMCITPCLSGKTFEIYLLSLRFSSRVSLNLVFRTRFSIFRAVQQNVYFDIKAMNLEIKRGS